MFYFGVIFGHIDGVITSSALGSEKLYPDPVTQYLRNHVPRDSRDQVALTLITMYYVPQAQNHVPSTFRYEG